MINTVFIFVLMVFFTILLLLLLLLVTDSYDLTWAYISSVFLLPNE